MGKIGPTKFNLRTQSSVISLVSKDELLTRSPDICDTVTNEVAKPVRRSNSQPFFERHLLYIPTEDVEQQSNVFLSH